MLEGEQRLLHAQGRQQHEVAHTDSLRRSQRVQVGLVVDGPGIARRAGA
jgi:hypothetical protein